MIDEELLRRVKILFIEDNPSDERMVREMLRDVADRSFQLDLADRLSTGIAFLAGSTVDVVLLDLSLPDSHGLATFRRVQTRAPDVPIVVMTDLNDQGVAVAAVREGAQDYLIKGQVDGQLLVRSLRYAIERKRAETERKRAEEQLAQQAEILRDLNERLVLTNVRQQEAEEERERLLGSLAAERNWLRTVIDRSPVGIFLIEDAEGEQVTVNRHAEALFGTPITPSEGLDQYRKLLFAADGSTPRHPERSSVRALAGEVITAEERLIRRSDGQTVPVLVSAGPIKDEQGNILGAAVVFDDMTAIKELERLREEWISIITHDLRQPVTVIKGYADLLAMHLPESSQERRELEHIRTSARSLTKMIEDLRDASQVETKRFTLRREWVDFPALVNDIVQRNAEIVGEGRVNVIVDGEIPRLWVDSVRIEQVLTNFLTNAARYGEPSTPILVRLNCLGEDVEVSVTNHGAGIAPEDLPHVFSRFYRTQAAKERRRGGQGLGLFIAKGIIEAHGGRIGVESIPNQTTTFHFSISGQGMPA